MMTDRQAKELIKHINLSAKRNSDQNRSIGEQINRLIRKGVLVIDTMAPKEVWEIYGLDPSLSKNVLVRCPSLESLEMEVK